MAIKILKGEVKINGEYYGAGAVLNDGVASEKDEKWLIKEGFAEAVEVSDDAFNIEKMTEKQLDKFAAENSIDLTGIRGKANKKAKILESLATSEDDDDDEDDDDGSDGDA